MSYCDILSTQFLFVRYVNSWIDTREVQSEKANLTILFEKYVPPCLDIMKVRFKKITPIAEIAHIQMLCYLLEVCTKERLLVLSCVMNDAKKGKAFSNFDCIIV